MRYKSLYILLFIVLCGVFSSCSSELDQAPAGKLSLDDIWKDNDKVSAYLNTCYKNMTGKGDMYYYWERGPVCWCDEAWDADDIDVNWVFSSRFYRGDATADDFPGWTVQDEANNSHFYTRYFESIHDCAYFLQHIDNATVTNVSDRSRWKAEAHLLRAYYYEELLRWLGCGLPLEKTPFSYDQDFSKLKQPSYYETVKFITADCDSALACPDLPWRITTSSESGRLPKSLACAIKSRMMLYAASPLYCGSNNYWSEAYTTTKASLDTLRAQGYALYNTLTNSGTFYTKYSYFGPDNYSLSKISAMLNEYFCTAADYSSTPRDKETIFQSRFGSSDGFTVEGIGAQHGFKSGACPSQELVDCFNTIDGQSVLDLSKPYNDEETHLTPNYNQSNTLYNPQDPYKNRDPRFYADIYYNGSKRYCWWPFDEVSQSYENYPGKSGFRTRSVMTYVGEPVTGYSATSRTKTRTGYYIRKYITPIASDNNGSGHGEVNFKEFRFAEMLLNFAEAAAETGQHDDEAIEAVNEVRERAGMPDLPSSLTGQALLNRIYNERRVEFALEEQRFFDVRRLHKPDEDLSTTDKWITAVKITRNSDGTFTYDRQQVNGTQRQCWSNKWLKWPFPADDINKIKAATGDNWQNPGW